MTDLLAALGGAVFAGVFGLAVAMYTNRQANKRAEKDRTERQKVRDEERQAEEKRRIHQQGMDAVHRFIAAVTRLQTDAYYYKTSPQQVTGDISEMEAARWAIAAYFPGTVYEMADMVRIPALSLVRSISNGEKDAQSKANTSVISALHEFVRVLHVELGHDFAVDEQERLRANPEPLKPAE